MSRTPEKQEKYLQELEELEQKVGGIFTCITPERHKKRWEQKLSKLEQQIVTATTDEEKEYLLSSLIELNHREQRKATHVALVHSLLAPES